ncbi:hypothetical protein R1sor_004518 [Riccia sorocarpa]|uniref:Chalcone-flavonone isomerase family protein n=1 Tax=Riccia sorocarpa TaxID=122646 RepID=A0ABD3HKF8_9MARC
MHMMAALGMKVREAELTVRTLETVKSAGGAPEEVDSGLLIEGVTLPPTLVAPGRQEKLTLLGGGVRKVKLPDGVELKVTVLGLYADLECVKYLSMYRGQSAEQLLQDQQFLHSFLEVPVDMVARVVFLLPLSGQEYARKSGDNTEEDLKAMNRWGEEEDFTLKEFREYFKTKNYTPGSSIYFTVTRTGLEISHSLDSRVPEAPEYVLKSGVFGQALLGTMVGSAGVSPQIRASFGEKMASLLQEVVAARQTGQAL